MEQSLLAPRASNPTGHERTRIISLFPSLYFSIYFPSKQHVTKSTNTRWDQAWCRLPSAIILPQVWWLLSPEEREKCVVTHSPRQHPVPSLAQFCGWQGGVGATKSSLVWQPRLTSGVLGGWFVLPGGDEVTGRCFSKLTALHIFLFCCKGPGRGW